MCGPLNAPDKIIKPEYRLAALMARDLCVAINPDLLKLFIQLHWSKVTKLAHEIHDQLEPNGENQNG